MKPQAPAVHIPILQALPVSCLLLVKSRSHSRVYLTPSGVHTGELLGGPEGPEPALGFSKNLVSHVDMSHVDGKQQAKQQKFLPNQPGGRAIFL
jgi:hypothetical protein